MASNFHRNFGIATVIAMVVIVTVSASFLWPGSGSSRINESGYLDQSQLNAINLTSQDVYVSSSNNTIYINGSSNLPVMMGPMNGPSMYSFEILGLYNPTLRILSGSQINFTIINIDTDSYHNFVISVEGPPYSSMMQGGEMMYSMSYLPPVHSGSYAFTNFTHSFSASGTYWYLCTYPGHAANGMYGKIIVY